MNEKKDKTSEEILTTLKWLKTEEKPATPKITYNDKSLEKIGKILKGPYSDMISILYECRCKVDGYKHLHHFDLLCPQCFESSLYRSLIRE